MLQRSDLSNQSRGKGYEPDNQNHKHHCDSQSSFSRMRRYLLKRLPPPSVTTHNCFSISRYILTMISFLYVGSTTQLLSGTPSSAYQWLNTHRGWENKQKVPEAVGNTAGWWYPSALRERARVGRLLYLHEQQFKTLILPGLNEVNIPVSFFRRSTFQVKIFHFS